MNPSDRRFIWFALLVIGLDQATKQLVHHLMLLHESHEILGDFVRLTYVLNPGGAFSSMLGGRIFYITVVSIASLMVTFYWWRYRHFGSAFSTCLGLILGGALGNLIDRIATGKVVDFIDMGFGMTRWPVYNVADAGVTVGVVLLIFATLFGQHGMHGTPEAAGKREPGTI